MTTKHSGMRRLLREFVEILEPRDQSQTFMWGPDIEFTDEWKDLSLAYRKAVKLLAIHDRRDMLEKQVDEQIAALGDEDVKDLSPAELKHRVDLLNMAVQLQISNAIGDY